MLGAFSAIDKKRKYTNEEYTVHNYEVADLLTMVRASDIVRAAAVLHDVVEDTKTKILLIKRMFGLPVAELVQGMTKPPKHLYPNRKVRNAAYNHQLSLGDADLHSIKAADITSNLNKFGVMLHFDPEFAAVYVPEKEENLRNIQRADPLLLQMATTRVNNARRMLEHFQQTNMKEAA